MALLKKPGKKKFFIVRLQALRNACKFFFSGGVRAAGRKCVLFVKNLDKMQIFSAKSSKKSIFCSKLLHISQKSSTFVP